MANAKRESPVISLRSGLTYLGLVGYLVECATAFAKWQSENGYMSPEISRSTTEAYKVALVTELIFKGSVRTHDFSDMLAGNNSNRFDVSNFQRACEEVVTYIDTWEKI